MLIKKQVFIKIKYLNLENEQQAKITDLEKQNQLLEENRAFVETEIGIYFINTIINANLLQVFTQLLYC